MRLYAVLFVVVLCLFTPFLHLLFSGERVLTQIDLHTTFLPLKYFWVESVLAEGFIPQWNPGIYAGNPFWADLKSSALYPLNFILLPFGSENFFLGFSYYIFAHFGLAAVAMFLFLRELKLPREAAAIFGLAYCFSGVAGSSIGMPNLLAAMWIIPLFALFLSRWRASKSSSFLSWDSLGLALTLALPAYSTTPDFSYFFGLYFSLMLIRDFSWARFSSFLGICVLAIALSAAQLLPGIEFLLETRRGSEGLPYEEAAEYIFHPARFIEFFTHYPFGTYFPQEDYWGAAYSVGKSRNMSFFFSTYMGIALLWGLLGLFREGFRKHLFSASICVLLFFLAQGRFAPFDLNALFFKHFPFWKIFKSPEKLLLLLNFYVLVGQAIGVSSLIERPPSRKVFFKLVAILGVLLTTLLLSAHFFVLIEERSFHRLSILNWLGLTALLSTVLFLKISGMKPFQSPWIFIALIIGLDSTSFMSGMIWDQPKLVTKSIVGEKIQKDLQSRHTDLSTGAAFRFSSQLVNRSQALPQQIENLDSAGVTAFWTSTVLLPNYPLFYGIHDIYGHGAMRSHEKTSLWMRLAEVDPQKTLNLLGAYYLARFHDANGKLNPTAAINSTALPYLSFPRKLLGVDPPNIHEALSKPTFNEQEMAILGGLPPGEELQSKAQARFEILDRKNDQLKIRLFVDGSSEASWMMINESFDPYWKAYMNGKRLELRRMNGWSLGLNLGTQCQGKCEIQLIYQNPLIRWGLFLTFGALTIFAALCFFRNSKRSLPDHHI